MISLTFSDKKAKNIIQTNESFLANEIKKLEGYFISQLCFKSNPQHSSIIKKYIYVDKRLNSSGTNTEN